MSYGTDTTAMPSPAECRTTPRMQAFATVHGAEETKSGALARVLFPRARAITAARANSMRASEQYARERTNSVGVDAWARRGYTEVSKFFFRKSAVDR